MPEEEREQGWLIALDKDTAVDDIERKLQTLIDYWIEHNTEHEKELRDWADKAAHSFAEVAEQMQKAAAKMVAANDELVKAKDSLSQMRETH